jgi:hypothetical protein
VEVHVTRPRLHLSRRQALSLGLIAGTMAAAPGVASAVLTATRSPAERAGTPPLTPWSSTKSQNGWPVVSSAAVQQIQVEGSDARAPLRPGPAASILVHVARRYHYEVESLGQDDVIGHRDGRTLQAPYESNRLSGTALWLNPSRHPIGATGTLLPLQVAALRDILAECDGVVRWGGDDSAHPAEGYFQIDARPGDPALKRVAARLSDWQTRPGLGAGGPVDISDPARLAQAKRLQRVQRQS